MNKHILIIDIDGVVADCSHRLHFIKGESKDYDSFYSAKEVMKDSPIMPIINMINALPYKKIFLTGRPERTRDATYAWLLQYFPEKDINIYMRPNGYYVNSAELKYQIFTDGILPSIPENIKEIIAIDDQEENLKAFRMLGVTTLKV